MDHLRSRVLKPHSLMRQILYGGADICFPAPLTFQSCLFVEDGWKVSVAPLLDLNLSDEMDPTCVYFKIEKRKTKLYYYIISKY